MSDDETRVIIDPSDVEPPALDAAPSPAERTQVPAGSVLARFNEDVATQTRELGLVLSVGRSDVLGARYRVLEQDEIERIGKRAEKIAKLERRKVDAPDIAALMLAEACVELVWIDDWDPGKGDPPSLVDVLAADGVDTRGDTPLRYDGRTAELLGLATTTDQSGQAHPSDVVTELHTWHTKNGSNLLPLIARSRSYNDWLEVEGLRGLEEALSGN